MATDYRWLGGAPAVAQVDFVTPATIEAGDIFKITLADDAGHSYQIAFTATDTLVKTVVEGLKAAALVASAAGYAPWDDVTPTEDDIKLILTAKTTGAPFYATTATVNGGANNTQTLTRSASVANSGPCDFNTAYNWAGNAVPAGGAGNRLIFERSAHDWLYGLDQSAAGTYDKIIIAQSFTGKIGQAELMGAGYAQVRCSDLEIGESPLGVSAAGSGRLKLDVGNVSCTVTVVNSSASSTDSAKYLPPIRLLANHATTKLHVLKGRAGLACEDAAETSLLDEIHQAYGSAGDSAIEIGPGVSVSDVYKGGGRMLIQCGADSLAQEAGECESRGSAALTLVHANGGEMVLNSTGTISTLYVDGAAVDMLGSTEPRTISTVHYKSGSFAYDPAVVSVTAAIVDAAMQMNFQEQ